MTLMFDISAINLLALFTWICKVPYADTYVSSVDFIVSSADPAPANIVVLTVSLSDGVVRRFRLLV